MADKTVSVSDQIEVGEYPKVAEAILDEYKRRKGNRKDLEDHWKEVDRQVAMQPEVSHKQTSDGKIDPSKAWMPEIELPLQAQTLEMLTADSRRFKFPKNRNWFKARAALTESYLNRYNAAPSVFPGERGDNSRSVIDQDNGDRLVEGLLGFWHSQYDFRGHIGLIDAEAFKYGTGVGRLRPVRRKIMGFEAAIGGREQVIPVYVPRSIKNVYLDDRMHALMHEGVTLAPSQIQIRTVNLADLKASAMAGGSDPNDRNGGYIADQIKRLVADKEGNVLLAELEGDLIHETSRDTIIERDVIVTAAMGEKGDKATHGMVRYRKGEGYSSYIVHKYHSEAPDSAYATSPLIKGMPVAKVAAQAMNRIMESAMLQNGPPIGYSKDDPAFTATGGPAIFPYALWESIDGIEVFDKVGGDPQAMFEVFAGMVQLYSDVTGVNPPRLGASTKSHTTAFAKDVELQQGAVRTLDYVNSDLEGPMSRLLQLEYKIGLRDMRGSETIYIESWNEFVTVTKKHFPDIVKFLAIGAGAPAEDQAQNQQRMQSANFALQLDGIAQQLGADPTIDLSALIRQVLSAGGWTDVDAITSEGQTVPPQSGGLENIGAITEQTNAGAI